MTQFRHYVKQFIPPILLVPLRRFRTPQGFTDFVGNYSSWEDAARASTGYAAPEILEKTVQALTKVKEGEALYEQDTILYEDVHYSWAALAGLLWAAAANGGALNVLDFGGSLGSTYFQNRAFLSKLDALRWNIVEQPKHVEVGRASFQDNVLRFYCDADACLAENAPNAFVFSGVLQCIERPHETLLKVLTTDRSSKDRATVLIVDRTTFWEGGTDRLCVQHFPPSLFTATIPSWIFAHDRFVSTIERAGFEVVAEFDGDSMSGPVPVRHKGFIAVR